uniref:Uncharacterized protein n=1 Tax=Rhizophora mucronata TaxID=61149 RepID=A0A2P2MK68_RHIMU
MRDVDWMFIKLIRLIYQAQKNNVELQVGYDSQFEDGELREYESLYYWGENEGKDKDVKHVDYGSECQEETLCSFGGKEIRVERPSSPGSDNASRKIESCGAGDAVRDDSVSPKTRTSDLTTGKDFSSVVAGSRASDGELRSCVKGPDVNPQKDPIITGRADSFYNLHSQDAKEATSKKLTGKDSVPSHMHGRSLGDRHGVNPSPGYRESGREYLPSSSIPTRPKSVFWNRGYMVATENAGQEIARFAGFDHCSRKQFYNSDSHTGYQHKMRRSPINRDYGYDIHAARLAVREMSPTRNRYRRSQQGFDRGIREEHHRRMKLENIGYSNRMSHRLARRERSISPPGRVRPHYAMAYRKSHSRSRSRSPAAYLRLRSRSPNFRSETRRERPRLSFNKHFSMGYEEGLFSLARSNCSPQHNSRWFDEQNGASDGYRGRKPTVRMFRQGQRFETVDPIWRFETMYPQRLNLDEEFSSMSHSRKFSNVEVTGREGEYEGSDCDRKKRSSRFEMFHRARRYETDEAVEWSQLQSSGFFCGQGLS